MEESLHNTNAYYFKNSILKIAKIKLEKELKKKLKKENIKNVENKKSCFKVRLFF